MGGVMVTVLVSIAVGRGLEPAALNAKSTDWLARKNVFEWSDMSIRKLLFQ
jgi:hypothetical protein